MTKVSAFFLRHYRAVAVILYIVGVLVLGSAVTCFHNLTIAPLYNVATMTYCQGISVAAFLYAVYIVYKVID